MKVEFDDKKKLGASQRLRRPCLPQRCRRVEFLSQIFGDLLNQEAARADEQERIFRAPTFLWDDDEVLGKKLRFARDGRTFEIDRLAKRLPILASDENDLMRLFVRRDQGAKNIRRNFSAASAKAGNGPRDGFAEKVLFREDGRETRRQ